MNPFEEAQRIAMANKYRVIYSNLDDEELMKALRAIALEGMSYVINELHQELPEDSHE